MGYIDFYDRTEDMFNAICSACGITSPNDYFSVADYHPKNIALSLYNINLNNWKQKAFFELAFHAANTTGGYLNSMIRFKNNPTEINTLLCGFDITSFLSKYPNTTPITISDFISDAQNLGLNIKNQASPPVSRWANACIKGALYINSFSNEKDFISDLGQIIGHSTWSSGQLNRAEKALTIRMSKPNGLGQALMCDFIREYDKCFDFISKPDGWIINVINSAKGNQKDYKDLTEYEMILQDIVSDVNAHYPGKNLTMYKLDRMIWLICSGDFFLDNIDLHGAFGNIYINRIKGIL